MTLREQIDQKKASEEAVPSCYKESLRSQPAAFIEFRPDPQTRTGFGAAQLLHYTLEPHRDNQDAPERLTLGFSTADVVILGVRLGKLVGLLNEHLLGSVSILDVRYAATLDKKPWVASISITRLDKSNGAVG